MRIIQTFVVIFLLVIWTAPAMAQKPAARSVRPSPPLTEHAFLMGLSGWKLDFRQMRGNGGLVEYVPQDEDIESWDNLISIHIIPEAMAVSTEQYRDLHVASFVTSCRSPERHDSTGTLSDGTPYVQTEMICRMRNPGAQGNVAIRDYEIATWRYIRTARSMYMLQRAWHGTRREWNAFRRSNRSFRDDWNQELNQVSICDFADPALVCPAVGLEAPGHADALITQRTEEINGGNMPLDIIHIMALTNTRGPIEEEGVRQLYQRQVARLAVRRTDRNINAAQIQSLPIDEHDWSSNAETTQIAQRMARAIITGAPIVFSADYTGELPATEAERIEDRVRIANTFFRVQQAIELGSDQMPEFVLELTFPNYR